MMLRQGLLIILLMLSYIGNTYALKYYRHIYNDSNQAWSLQADSKLGNVYIQAPGCSNQKNGPCTIPPKTTVEVHYTRSGGRCYGELKLIDSRGVYKSIHYGNYEKNDAPSAENYTPAVGFSMPAVGDIYIVNDYWDYD